MKPGFEPGGVFTAQLALPPQRYDREKLVAFYEQFYRSLAALPGSTSAALTDRLPLTGAQTPAPIAVVGRAVPPMSERPNANRHLVSPAYFKTLGIPFRAGRDFDERDSARVPHVVIVNETFARRHFPSEDPIGRTLITGMGQMPSQIVGVVADVRSTSLNTPPEADYFLPALQRPEAFTNILVRTNVGPAAMAPAVREALRVLDPDLPLLQPQDLTTRIAQTVANRKLALRLLEAFAILALVLATLGVYSVMAHLVAFRTSEIGLRMALGASPGAVMRMVLGHGRRLTLVGIAIGIAGALGVSRLMQQALFEVNPADPLVYVALSVGLLLVTEAASWFPARRATRIDPVIALRTDEKCPGPSMDLRRREFPGHLRKQSFFAPTEPRRRASGIFFTTTKRGCRSSGISRCWRNRSGATTSRRTTCRPHSSLRLPEPPSSAVAIVTSRHPSRSHSRSRACGRAHRLRRGPGIPAARLCDRDPPAIAPDCTREAGPHRVLVHATLTTWDQSRPSKRTAASSRASSPVRMMTNRNAATGLPRAADGAHDACLESPRTCQSRSSVHDGRRRIAEDLAQQVHATVLQGLPAISSSVVCGAAAPRFSWRSSSSNCRFVIEKCGYSIPSRDFRRHSRSTAAAADVAANPLRYFDNCTASLEEVQRAARQLGVESYLEIVKGWFEETLPRNKARVGPIAILRIHADGTKACRVVAYLYDQVVGSGFVVFDDYYFYDGCAVALHEFLGSRRIHHRVESLPLRGEANAHYLNVTICKGPETWALMPRDIS